MEIVYFKPKQNFNSQFLVSNATPNRFFYLDSSRHLFTYSEDRKPLYAFFMYILPGNTETMEEALRVNTADVIAAKGAGYLECRIKQITMTCTDPRNGNPIYVSQDKDTPPYVWISEHSVTISSPVQFAIWL